MNNAPPPLPNSEQPAPVKKESNGCGWLAGCLILAVVVTACAASVAGYFTYKAVKELADVQDDKPSVEQFIPSEEDEKSLKDKLLVVKNAQKNGGKCSVELDSTDVNTFIANASDDAPSKTSPRFAVQIEDGKIHGNLSVPVKNDKTTKYINCAAAVEISINKGELDVRLGEVLLKGKKPPLAIRALLMQFQNQNLAESINTNYQHKDLREKLKHCKKLEIKGDKIMMDLDFPKPKEGE